MKRLGIFAISLSLLIIAVTAWTEQQSLPYGIWELFLEIYQGDGIRIVQAEENDDPIMTITFETEAGYITHRSGRMRRFLWEGRSHSLSIRWLIQKNELFVIESKSLYVEYDIGSDGTLLLRWPQQDWIIAWYLLRPKQG